MIDKHELMATRQGVPQQIVTKQPIVFIVGGIILNCRP